MLDNIINACKQNRLVFGAIRSVLANYQNFDGRASRSEFWYFTISAISAGFVAQGIDRVIGTEMQTPDGDVYGGILNFLLLISLLIPSVAVATRRLHDLNRSGWRQLIVLIPIGGWILLVVSYCSGGTIGPNCYGDKPTYFV